MKIGLLSDTHSYVDDQILRLLADRDEIWHAGDFGSMDVAEQLKQVAPLRGVYGNIDGKDIRQVYPKVLRFEANDLDVLMTHIGGYPGKYHPDVREMIQANPPQLYITGHSHILKIMPDKKLPGLLHINPGASGKHGFHKIRTMVRFSIESGQVRDLQVIELGKRA
ncbi:metallophosphoesterase family protein [Pontibacter liquoris]|uniref:metallophosphoesterase family protein n=1 Tax=Pontibacter liquoris TaxID=2905677 RepID=UPI001FA6DA5D|nr:metallophosphoesterase family protein [Pontibacter liquoris]